MYNLVKPPDEVLTVPLQHSTGFPLTYSLILGAIIGLSLITLGFIYRKKLKFAPLICILLLSVILPSIPQALAINFGTPLATANISLFGYYNETTNFVLANTLPAFVNYTDHSNFIDGYVRVWHDVTGNNYVGNDVYTDVSVRVRSDGWILAWLDTVNHDATDVPYYGNERDSLGANFPVWNATTVHRAIQRVYYVAGKTFPGYDNIFLYDFDESSATMLLLFSQRSIYRALSRQYFIVPSNNVTNIEKTRLSWGGVNGNPGGNVDSMIIEFNSVLIANRTNPVGQALLEFGYEEYTINPTGLDARQNLTMYGQQLIGGGTFCESYVVCIMWMR